MPISDKEKIFGRLSETLAAEVSQIYQIQNPGRVPRGDVLLDVFSLLQLETREVKELGEIHCLSIGDLSRVQLPSPSFASCSG